MKMNNVVENKKEINKENSIITWKDGISEDNQMEILRLAFLCFGGITLYGMHKGCVNFDIKFDINELLEKYLKMYKITLA